ncbi:hypothetical protein [Alteromonas hispanica]|uniref:DUF115 domain-containing protein n=1 Tax=Alteromonas hispanica TaxID=315421 RepID=A0A6L9MTP2_9ALTE|nr:hypothetical protein [Alteromonas hispanica]NDW21619.1 hypothetical protein [Alteromonas hispanica]
MSDFKRRLRDASLNSNTDEELIRNLKNLFHGKTAFIVSAGPSALHWKKVYDSIVHDCPIVVCIKQTIFFDELSSLCDIHFINSYNVKKWKYSDSRVFKILTKAENDPPSFCKSDLTLNLQKKESDGLTDTLCSHLQFDDYTFDKSGLSRPWGPGIMHESVIFTLLHLGIARIVTIGWDIADAKGNNTHIDDNEYKNDREKPGRKLKWLRKLRLMRLINFVKFHFGRTINQAGMMDGEAALTSSSIPYLRSWLKKHGITLEVHSNSTWIH